MRKGKRLYIRRARALRTTAAALALLLFCNGILHIGFLLPIQLLRVCEQYQGVYERTRVVWRRWELGMMHGVDALYLTEGENTLSLFCANPSVYGWMDGFVWPVDTSDGGDVHAGVVGMSHRGREDVLVFYGRVKGTEDVELTANVCTVKRADAEHIETVHVYGHGIGKADCFVREGYTYFIFIEPYPVPEEARREHLTGCQLFVNRGEEHIAYEIEQTAAAFWG